MPEKKESANKKTFIWLGLRISFWLMLALWIISAVYSAINATNGTSSYSTFWLIVSIVWIISIVFTFVVSIIHLTKYKQKALAITALVISSILILLSVIGFLTGLGGAV